MLTACPLRVLRWLAVLFYARVCIFFINTRQKEAPAIGWCFFLCSGGQGPLDHAAGQKIGLPFCGTCVFYCQQLT